MDRRVAQGPAPGWKAFFLVMQLCLLLFVRVSGAHGTGQDDLFQAISKGDVAQLALLLQQKGVDVNGRNSRVPIAQQTPLALAVELEQAEMVALLLAGGADVNKRVGFWQNISPVYIAAKQGNLEMVKTLLAAGARLEPNRWTRLQEALATPLNLLRGDVVDFDLRRPPSLLEAAEASGNEELAPYLRKRGAR